MNTEQVLTRLKLDPGSRALAVQQVREQIENSPNPLSAAKVLFDNFVASNTDFTFTDANEARMTVAFLVDNAIQLGERYDPTDALKRAAEWIVHQRVENPYFFYKPEGTVATETVQQHGVAVEVKTDGKLKKGSKQILAKALYDKDPALDNKTMIQLFMKELNMSEAGARTYVYNCRKAAK